LMGSDGIYRTRDVHDNPYITQSINGERTLIVYIGKCISNQNVDI
jgi:hypothetical protein